MKTREVKGPEEHGAQANTNEVTVPRQMIDDLVRTIAYIALEGAPLPPEMTQGTNGAKAGATTAERHAQLIDRAQRVMRKHRLREWLTADERADATQVDMEVGRSRETDVHGRPVTKRVAKVKRVTAKKAATAKRATKPAKVVSRKKK